MPSSQSLHSPGLLHTAHSPGTWAWGSSVLFNRVSDPHPADVSDIRQQARPPAAVFLWLITSQSTSLHLRLFPWLVENGALSGTSTYSTRNSIVPSSENVPRGNYSFDRKPPHLYVGLCTSVNISQEWEAQEGSPTSLWWQVVYMNGVTYSGYFPQDKNCPTSKKAYWPLLQGGRLLHHHLPV